MSISAGQLVLLDTQIIVHLARGNEFGRRIDEQFQLISRAERALFSTVTEGELFGLALGWHWGEKKLARLHEILAELVRVESSLPQVVEAYAYLYHAGTRSGHKTGENDLWIAATAKAVGAVLLSDDNGFRWMNPDHLNVIEPDFT